MKIIQAEERSTVALQLSDLLKDGKTALRLRPDLIGRGLIEIRQRGDRLSLGINGVIGQVPVTDNIILDIKPKFPVSNLNTLVYGSGMRARTVLEWDRPYRPKNNPDYLPVPLVRSYTQKLEILLSIGLNKEYLEKEISSGLGTRINFSKSLQRHWSKLQPTQLVLNKYSFENNNEINQLLKVATLSALAISKKSPQLTDCINPLISSARNFSNVDTMSAIVAGNLMSTGLRMPGHRVDYLEAVSLAFDIVRHTDFNLDLSSNGTFLESFIICLDDVFEHFIRNSIRSFSIDATDQIRTVDGNIYRHQRSLFRDNTRYRIKPDLIVKRDGEIKIIGDVKYKKKPKEEDRYQIISHALSYGVSTALLIYPRQNETSETGLKLVGNIGSICLYHFHYDLSAENLNDENQKLRDAISQII